MTLTEQYGDELKRLGRKGRRDLKAAECSIARIRAYYRAAKKHGIKSSIQNTPDGMRLWRLT